MGQTVDRPPNPDQPALYVDWLIRRLSDDLPPRRAGSRSELEAQEIVATEFRKLGVQCEFEGFRFSDDLYRVLALHSAVGLLGTVVGRRRPGFAAALHALSAGSYWLDSTKRAEVLRRALPYVDSQNLLATIPAIGKRKLRIVYLAHIDAALTGLLFDPRFVKAMSYKGTDAPYHTRSLALATHSQVVAALLSAARAMSNGNGRRTAIHRMEMLLAVPALVSFLLNADVSRRQKVVPGAVDDLSGVAGAVVLAHRLEQQPVRNVEFVFAVTGAEEAGTGGARMLCRAHKKHWDPGETIIVALDGLTNGDLFWVQSGELKPKPLAPWVDRIFAAAAASDDRFAGTRKYKIPVGSTDAAPFQYAGYDGTTISCVDLSIGSPRGYHHPTDTADNMDLDQLLTSIDFAEVVTRMIVADRLA